MTIELHNLNISFHPHMHSIFLSNLFSRIELSPGLQCDCPAIETAPFYLKPGENGTTISWKRPDPVCSSGSSRILDFTWSPVVHSPATFVAGRHAIEYKFYISGNQVLTCTVVFDIRGEF